MLDTIRDQQNNLYVKLGKYWYSVLDPETYNRLIENGCVPLWDNVPQQIEEIPTISGVVIGRDCGIKFVPKMDKVAGYSNDTSNSSATVPNNGTTANLNPIPVAKIEQ